MTRTDAIDPETVRADAIRDLLDKQAITETLMRYSRAMDRRDRALASAIYWPDATDDHILYQGDVPGFLEFSFGFMEGVTTVHFLGNVLIELQSETAAFSETYYIAYHDMKTETGREDLILWGRYLDDFEKRGNEWRIKSRTLALDAYTVAPASAVWGNGMFAGLRTRGRAKPDDPLYHLHPRGVNA